MPLIRSLIVGGTLFLLAACQSLPSHTKQTLYGLTFEPWPWAPVQCFGCDWSDNDITLKDGIIRRVEARKSGELKIVAARGDRGGDVLKAFSISPQRKEALLNLRFANSYRDAAVKITDKNGERRLLDGGQFAPVYIDGELWTLYIVRATEWQENLSPSTFLIDWVLLKE